MSEFYSINDLAQMTGLTTRTLRNYINAGALTGEKDEGVWRFSGRDLEAFFADPGAQRAVRAAQKAILYDFLLDDRKKANEICVILDCPGKNQKEMAEFFCYRISNGDFQKIHFSFDGAVNTPRVTLTGDTAGVLRLVNGFMAEKGAD